MVMRASAVARTPINVDDRVVIDPSGTYVLSVLPQEQAQDLLLEETPDVSSPTSEVWMSRSHGFAMPCSCRSSIVTSSTGST